MKQKYENMSSTDSEHIAHAAFLGEDLRRNICTLTASEKTQALRVSISKTHQPSLFARPQRSRQWKIICHRFRCRAAAGN
jgi:hypothetical protein